MKIRSGDHFFRFFSAWIRVCRDFSAVTPGIDTWATAGYRQHVRNRRGDPVKASAPGTVAGICQHMRPARTCQTGTASATRATRQAGKDLSSHEASRDTSQPVSGSNEASRNHHGAGDAAGDLYTVGIWQAHRDLLPVWTDSTCQHSRHVETDSTCQSMDHHGTDSTCQNMQADSPRRNMTTKPGRFRPFAFVSCQKVRARRYLEQIETNNQSETWSRSNRPRPTTYGHGQSRTRPK